MTPSAAINSSRNQTTGHPSPISLAHVVLRTNPPNYQRMISFYQRLLNATIVHTTPVLTFLRYDHEHHRIAIINTPDTIPKPEGISHAGLDHIAFTYASLTALAQAYTSLLKETPPQSVLRKTGDSSSTTTTTTTSGETETAETETSFTSLKPVWAVNHGPTTSLYYRDPDGNKVELQVDNFETPEEADAFMKGDLFGMNPIGTDFDADQWAKEVLAKGAEMNRMGLLRKEEERDMKIRVEIGERMGLPEGF